MIEEWWNFVVGMLILLSIGVPVILISMRLLDRQITKQREEERALMGKLLNQPKEWHMQRTTEDTPWAVQCLEHGKVVLSRKEYDKQMGRPDARWECPICLRVCMWDDDHEEEWYRKRKNDQGDATADSR